MSMINPPQAEPARPIVSAAQAEDLSEEEISLTERAELLHVRLTRDEVALLAKQAGAHEQDLRLTKRKFLLYSKQKAEREIEREAFLTAIEEPAGERSEIGKWLLPVIGYIGTASYAMAGTQVAGEAGMNIVGCVFIGCVSSMGGGTVNSLLYGYARHGVPWVVDPRNLFIALVFSAVTFFLWPLVCRTLAEERLQSIQASVQERGSWWSTTIDRIGLASRVKNGIARKDFVLACEDEGFYKRVRKALAPQCKAKLPGVKEPTSAQLFDLIDLDGNGVLDLSELQRLVLLEQHGSTARYVVDTIALSTSSVYSAASAISRGLHPVVCAVSGVTVCFGGILRDLICKRDVALASQSFAASTGAGATAYVVMRELCLLGVPLPLNLRVLVAMGTTITVRVLDFYADGSLLPPMHGRPTDQDKDETPEVRIEVRAEEDSPGEVVVTLETRDSGGSRNNPPEQ